MKEIKDRSEVSSKYKWDLKAIYKNEKELDKDEKHLLKLIEELPKYKDLMLNSGEKLYETTNKLLEASRINENIYVYAYLKYTENIALSSSIALYDRAVNLDIKLNTAISYYDSKLLSLEYEDIEKMFESYPKLKEYERYIKNLFRYKKYMLNENEEKLIASLKSALVNNEKTFINLTDSDIDFGNITDEEGNEVKLTNTNYSRFVESKDRRVRREAFLKLYSVYERFGTTLAGCLDAEIKANATICKLRGYDSSLDAAMFSDELDKKVFNAVIESVSDGFAPLYKYYDLKKKILGLEELHVYDTYAKILDDYNKTYDYESAKELIKKVLSVFGDEYLSYVNKSFDENWIDALPNKGKLGGAFSGGGYDTYPYILTNFQEEFGDVSTLIHELGHSMHSYYSRKNNPYVYSGYSIVVAEVASTVNELLLAKYVINNSNDIREKLYVLDKLINLFKATIYRQTMYEEFEQFLYEKAEREESLTSDVLNEKFFKLNEKYFGSGVILDDVIKCEWERMPHLYYNFYMYKYTTGLSAACHIVDSILSGKKDAVTNYIEFLKQGSRMAPNEELKITGVDLTKREVCDNAIKMFSEIVDEFEKTYYEYKRSGGVNE